MRLTPVRAVLIFLLSPLVLAAQIPRIGVLDFYGVHKVPLDRLRKALGVAEGDRLPASKADVEDRLEQVPGVVLARLEAICCTDDRAVLYVGIEERGAPHFDFLPEPAGNVTLPDSIVFEYRGFVHAYEDAARRGDTAENFGQGHPLASDAGTREHQERFPQLAQENLQKLREVLRNSSDPEQRAIAAYVLAYVKNKQQVTADLQAAMRDSDEGVRANAMRSLGAIAALGVRDHSLEIRVQPTWFIESLNSLVWSDRERAAAALVTITESRDPAALDELRSRALKSLVEIARWKTLAHALPAFILVGRIAGLPEQAIHEAWTNGEREKVIERALSKSRHPDA